jgi:putative ABC transport system permease protein
MINSLAPNFSQSPNNTDYILSQYEIVAGEIADDADEIMLVLDSNDELTDLLLAKLGYYSQAELMEIIHKISDKDADGNSVYDEALYREYFTYDELLGKTLTWYPTDSVFSTTEVTISNPITGNTVTTAPVYTGELDSPDSEGMTLKVVGILTPNDNISYGVLSSGIYYTEALTQHILEENENSEFIDFLIGDEEKAEEMLLSFTYSYDYLPYEAFDKNAEDVERKEKKAENVFSYTTRASIARNLGGNSLANKISIYPISFDDKNLVTQYLDAWNDENKTLVVNGVEIAGDARREVTYTDTLELIINMVNKC